MPIINVYSRFAPFGRIKLTEKSWAQAAPELQHYLEIMSQSVAGSHVTQKQLATILTTKGDLYGFSSFPDRLPVGVDGTTIVADSTQALGLKWETPVKIFNVVANDNTTNFLMVAGTLPLIPTTTVNGVSIIITAAGSAAAFQRGMLLQLQNGYSGSNPTTGLLVQNLNTNGNATQVGIHGFVNDSSGSTVGDLSNRGRIGVYAQEASSGGGIPPITSHKAALWADVGNGGAHSIVCSRLGASYAIQFAIDFAGGVYLGDPEGIAAPINRSISGAPALGVDKVGADLALFGGLSTGAAVPSKVRLKTSVAIGSSATLQTNSDAFIADWDAVQILRGIRVKAASLGAVTLDNQNHVVRVDTSAGPVTITLPAVAAGNRGIWYRFKNEGANALTIARTGADTIDGAATKVLASQYDSTDILCPEAGTDWVILGGGGGAAGPTGPTGPVGPPGPPGLDGEDGPVGLPGPLGATGPTGADGAQGLIGVPGLDGEDGPPGIPGIQGPAGVSGTNGTNGIDGRPGFDGVDGVDGFDGRPGLDGATGPQGLQGLQGPPGPPGEDGDPGPIGLTGPIGPQGPAGGGGGIWTEAEVDFGSKPVYDVSFTLVDAAITSSAVKIQILQSGKAATARVAGDEAWDAIDYAANPGTGSATVWAKASPGPVVGKRKYQYMVS